MMNDRPTKRGVLRYLWAGPTTALGLVAVGAAMVSGGRARVVDGVIEVWGGAVRVMLEKCTTLPGGARALTLGHVVLGVSATALDVTRRHERVHVRQCERWGPVFIPAYLLASLSAKWRGGDAYRDNRFEVEAYADG